MLRSSDWRHDCQRSFTLPAKAVTQSRHRGVCPASLWSACAGNSLDARGPRERQSRTLALLMRNGDRGSSARIIPQHYAKRASARIRHADFSAGEAVGDRNLGVAWAIRSNRLEQEQGLAA